MVGCVDDPELPIGGDPLKVDALRLITALLPSFEREVLRERIPSGSTAPKEQQTDRETQGPAAQRHETSPSVSGPYLHQKPCSGNHFFVCVSALPEFTQSAYLNRNAPEGGSGAS